MREDDLRIGMRVKVTNTLLDYFGDWEHSVCIIVGLRKRQGDSYMDIEMQEEGDSHGSFDGWKAEDITLIPPQTEEEA